VSRKIAVTWCGIVVTGFLKLKSATTQKVVMKSEFKAQTEFEEEFDEYGNLFCYSRIETDREFYVSLNLAAILTGRDRATVTRAARELESFDGPKGAKLYRYRHFLELVARGAL
jgi:hypothetical protein